MGKSPAGTVIDEVFMKKRERIKLERVDGDRNRIKESNSLVAWYDTSGISELNANNGLLPRVFNQSYTGIVLYPDNFAALSPTVPARLVKVLHVEKEEELRLLPAETREDYVVASPHVALLKRAIDQGLRTCYRAYVDDGASLHASIQEGSQHNFLMIRFRDPTNIPLELVIASLQATHTILIKEIGSPEDMDDALVTLGVMEVGADGVMFSPRNHGALDEFLRRLGTITKLTMKLSVGAVRRAVPIGMGYRSCIDTTTMFSPTEGILVGSTSHGGVLCCPEVFYLPYMELRPFRVNAGAVHSYVYNYDNRTDYMSELRAGSPVMIVDRSGTTRRGSVGRMKTEVRPLRLIEVDFPTGEYINVIMQDDWHVRIFSDEAKPLNITELRPGDKVLGHVAIPGRHVGIKVDEHIIET
ncbi:MAG TPA: 3-dehydroquinate synthase II [Kofleriaceae bacterium]|nr:3-dehydroquinate synthase II [Kofleriaceae bacterium]